MKYVDMHNHGYELGEDVLEGYSRDYILVVVADDLESSFRVLELARKYDYVKPCIGIHPWSIGETPLEHLDEIARAVDKYDVRCLGEVGLDTRFVARTIEKQRVFFRKFLELAREYDLLLNLHTAGTWREVYEMLIRYDISRAYFHWYTGPLSLLEEIRDKGYYIGANPAWRIQARHRRVLEEAPLDMVVTESDAPYRYKGITMKPELVKDTVDYLAEIKGVNRDAVVSTIYRNYLRLYR